eukprot:scaffold24159_cov117-Isochrysis_galbana.AAC.6
MVEGVHRRKCWSGDAAERAGGDWANEAASTSVCRAGRLRRVHLMRAVHVDGARAVDLAELPLEVGVPEAHWRELRARQLRDGELVDVARLGDTKRLGGLGDVERVDLGAPLERDGARGAVVDCHRVAHLRPNGWSRH